MWFDDLKQAFAAQGDRILASFIAIWAFALLAEGIGAEAAFGPALALRLLLGIWLRWPSIQAQLTDAYLRHTFAVILTAALLIALVATPHLLMWGLPVYLLVTAATHLRSEEVRAKLAEPLRGWLPEHLRTLWIDLRALTLVATGVVAALLAWRGDLLPWLLFIMFGGPGLSAMADATFRALARNADP